MILTGNEIAKNHQDKKIVITNFNPHNLSTNSYDLSLGPRLIRYTEPVLDPFKDNPYEIIEIPPEGYLLKSGEFVLGESNEKLGSNNFVPIIHGKSSTARLGLFVHITADLIDIGSIGKTTFQLFATLPILLKKGMKVGQASFWQPVGEISLYEGKYQNSDGPIASKAYLDHGMELV